MAAQRPDIDVAALRSALRTHYGIDALSLAFQAGGEDDSAWVYRVDTGPAKPRYLLKVREAGGRRDVAATVSRHLCDSGLPHVVAPIRSSTGSLTLEAEGRSLTVYPFVEGRTGVEAGLAERHWRALGRLARSLHATALPADLLPQLARETYRPPALELVREVDRAVSSAEVARGVARDVAGFWAAHRAEILALVGRTEELGPELERRARPFVLCHADLHTWNVLIDGDGGLWLVDWDEVVLAPKERDLMFVVGGIGAGLIEPQETAWFFEGYGEAVVDPLALSYYRHAWAVQDIGGYGARVFLTSFLSEGDRAHAARILRGLFGPGQIVELALAS